MLTRCQAGGGIWSRLHTGCVHMIKDGFDLAQEIS